MCVKLLYAITSASILGTNTAIEIQHTFKMNGGSGGWTTYIGSKNDYKSQRPLVKNR